METVTKKYKVYNYNELSENAKENVQQMFSMNDADFETELLGDDFQEQLKENHPYFTDAKFQWSLGCCQGDGLSFSCQIDLGEYLKVHHKDMKTSVYDALCDIVYNLHSDGNNGHYCFASESDIDYDYNYGEEHKRLDALLNNIVDVMRVLYINICKDFEEQGYKAYEFLGTDEYAKDMTESNDYTFLENGEMFNS